MRTPTARSAPDILRSLKKVGFAIGPYHGRINTFGPQSGPSSSNRHWVTCIDLSRYPPADLKARILFEKDIDA
jgi:hypothetical protein